MKENPEGVSEMCKVMEDMRNEALQEGIKEGASAAAGRMLADGTMALEKIAEYTGLPMEEVEKLNKESRI